VHYAGERRIRDLMRRRMSARAGKLCVMSSFERLEEKSGT